MLEIDRIYNADCFEGMKQIESGTVDCIVTDPPYVIEKHHGGGSVNKVKKLNDSLKQLDVANLRDGYNMEAFAQEVKRLQGGKINAYIWCNKAQIADYFRIYVSEMKCKYEIICWHKQNALPTYYNKYLSDTEYCLFFHKGSKTHPKDYEDAKTYEVGYINHKDKKLWGHPSIKPLELMQRFIRNSTNEGDLILDPFMGSGTTAIACMRENRHFIGFELNEDYHKIAMKRIEYENSLQTIF